VKWVLTWIDVKFSFREIFCKSTEYNYKKDAKS